MVTGNRSLGEGFVEAFQWTKTMGVVGLGDFPGSSLLSHGTDISFDGSVVVGFGYTDNGYQAFRWTEAEGLVALGDIIGGGVQSQATSISSDGTIIAGWGESLSGREAYRWTAATGMIGIGGLSGDEFRSVARAIAHNGEVIVGDSESGSGTEAFRWTADAGMIGLGDLAGGTFFSQAWGANRDGSVIVGWSDGPQGKSAFIWTAAEGMQPLQNVLVSDYGLDLTGWSLEVAFGISEDGNAIVGRGTNPDGNVEGWIAYLNCLPGDANDDDSANGLDIHSFIAVYLSTSEPDEGTLCTFDLNRNGIVDHGDVLLFAELLVG